MPRSLALLFRLMIFLLLLVAVVVMSWKVYVRDSDSGPQNVQWRGLQSDYAEQTTLGEAPASQPAEQPE